MSELSAWIKMQPGAERPAVDKLLDYSRRYPYCQPAHMLLALVMKHERRDPDGTYEKVAMVYAPDRVVFRRCLETPLYGEQYIGKIDKQSPESNILSLEKEVSSGGELREVVKEEEMKATVLSEKQRKQQELIERFLDSEPRISPKPETSSDSQTPVLNQEMFPEVISETLADILMKQGEKQRAREMYEKLCLKYPEKSSYFAKKLESIETENNNPEQIG